MRPFGKSSPKAFFKAHKSRQNVNSRQNSKCCGDFRGPGSCTPSTSATLLQSKDVPDITVRSPFDIGHLVTHSLTNTLSKNTTIERSERFVTFGEQPQRAIQETCEHWLETLITFLTQNNNLNIHFQLSSFKKRDICHSCDVCIHSYYTIQPFCCNYTLLPTLACVLIVGPAGIFMPSAIASQTGTSQEISRALERRKHS